ncbi:dihydroorotase, homodimeric type [Aspergillus udagawae]|nr:dihydroorotase, homodimeric type [Aspergillus udagawae]
MILKETTRLELPAAADMHVHLRQGKMMELVVPQIRKGGVDTVFVMPNLVPPVTSVAQALEYKAQLQAIEPNSLLTGPYQSVTPETIREAAAAGITGVKVYPQGVTTNSAAGVRDYDEFIPVFAEMEKHDMVLNLHGEVPGSPGSDITDMNAEEKFLPTLKMLNERFPRLRIILEHCSTEAALEAVRSCSSSVAATITAHHLYLTHHSCENPLAFCKPLPKTSKDRDALLRAVCSGDPKFFFGSDSAPHPRIAKQGGAEGTAKPPAGVFTQPCVVQYVLLALEEGVERGVIANEDITQEKLANFLSVYGRRFYKLPEATERIVLERNGEVIPESVKSEDGSVEVALSRGGDEVFSLTWKSS